MIEEIVENKGAVCATILAALPGWFQLPAANAAFVRDVEAMPMLGAIVMDQPVGFLALKVHTLAAAEIHVMGVRPEHHRKGLGRALIRAAAQMMRADGMRYLTVKTLAPSHPDPGYANTRAFYESAGFSPVEVFPLLWDAENPALMMVKAL